MIVLGIEGSANKLGVGIIKNNEILCNLRKTYCPPKGEGFIPSKAAEHHRQNILDLIQQCLDISNLKIDEIDALAYTRGPGIQQSLVVVATVVRTLSLILKKPIIPVNHCIAHIEMGRLVTKAINPVILYVSGGNTQILAYFNKTYKIFGETLDIAVGNCLDKIARDLNLDNFPSPGLSIEKLARKGKNYIDLPYCVKGMDMSFSGILSYTKRLIKQCILKESKNDHIEESDNFSKINKTDGKNLNGLLDKAKKSVTESNLNENLLEKINKVNITDKPLKNFDEKLDGVEIKDKCSKEQLDKSAGKIDGLDVEDKSLLITNKFLNKKSSKAKLSKSDNNNKLVPISVEDLCYSIQETIFSMLVEVTERCMSFVGSKEVMIVGGVGCNLRLQEMMKIMAEERGAVLYATDERYCIDNGAMIAYTGYLMHKAGERFELKDCDVTQRFRTDSVKVSWRE